MTQAVFAPTLPRIAVLTFLVLAVGGIAQAEWAFVPETYETRPRALPPAFAGVRVTPFLVPVGGVAGDGFVRGAQIGLAGVF